jgi:hypothetical protein
VVAKGVKDTCVARFRRDDSDILAKFLIESDVDGKWAAKKGRQFLLGGGGSGLLLKLLVPLPRCMENAQDLNIVAFDPVRHDIG